MNIRGNHRNKIIRMNLEQALLQNGNDINFLVLNDGTSIEIIDDYQNENDEFVEEKFDEDNYGYNNYIYKEIDQNGTLRGKGLKKNNNMKPLRKTILKSINNDEGKLRSTVHDNNNNAMIKISENNEYLQCAHCFKFFNEKNDEEETDNSSNNNNNINNINTNKNFNNNQIQPQNYNNINNINNNKNIRPQMPAQIPPKQNIYNQQYIPNQPNIPRQVIPPQQQYNQNYQTNFQQQQPYYNQNPGK